MERNRNLDSKIDLCLVTWQIFINYKIKNIYNLDVTLTDQSIKLLHGTLANFVARLPQTLG